MSVCVANPGGTDGHTHDIAWIDTLTGNGATKSGGTDGHTHQVVNWRALPGNTGHDHHVTCSYDDLPGVNGGGGIGCGF